LGKAAILVAAALLLGGCGPRSGQKVADFQLKDLSGKNVSLSDYRGRPVLLDFWATWCGPCQMSVPLVQDFYERHKASGVAVLGINVDDDPSEVYPFVKHFKMTYPVLYAGTSSVQADLGVQSLPTFMLLDGEGKLVERFDGFHPSIVDAWDNHVKRLVKSS
jgi:cytochrome c biogenesis protein CcmG/thiol:disulfide interchange protein DsbE